MRMTLTSAPRRAGHSQSRLMPPTPAGALVAGDVCLILAGEDGAGARANCRTPRAGGSSRMTGGLHHRGQVRAARRVGAWIVWWVLLMSFWVVLDDSIALDELLAGAIAAALGALVAELTTHQAKTRFRMRI